ncbi:uncharacterized FtsW-like protein [Arthrobacter sp. Hiyo8]|nr:uncharacterized FtsW-like protein [Arthrobacter sp. Hiyo8]
MADGGLIGKGLGLGSPDLVPFANSDMIIASLGEELGLIGLFAIVLLYLLLFTRGFRAALGIRDAFGKLLACGLAFSMALQCFIIIGGVTRLIPLTGSRRRSSPLAGPPSSPTGSSSPCCCGSATLRAGPKPLRPRPNTFRSDTLTDTGQLPRGERPKWSHRHPRLARPRGQGTLPAWAQLVPPPPSPRKLGQGTLAAWALAVVVVL